jgi:diguanylate cyclase (GGDEF)-like protein
MAENEPDFTEPVDQIGTQDAEHFRGLSDVWLPAAAGLAALAATFALVLASDDRALGAAAGVIAASVLLCGLPRQWGRAMAVVAPLTIVGGFVWAESFDERFRTVLLLVVTSAFVCIVSLRLASRRRELIATLADLHVRAERRSIRDAVEESLAGRRRNNFVDREFTRAQRYGREVSIVIAEVDNLELLRREQGPAAVEDVLVSLGELFASDTRLPDGGLSEDLRLIYVLPETNLLGGRVVAERVRLNFLALHLEGASDIPLTVSIGVSSYPVDGDRVPEVLASAEAALGRAVSRGGNRTIISRSPDGTPAGWSAS